MKSLLQHFKTLNREDWDYFTAMGGIPLDNPFSSRLSHMQFVQRFFRRAGKGDVLSFQELLPGHKLDNNRTKHTNSIFFLGILLAKDANLRPPFFSHRNIPGYHTFPFMWFLTCLFHDFAFTMENDKSSIQKFDSLDSLIATLKIDHLIKNQKPDGISDTLFTSASNYFRYRVQEDGKLDHGIIGGLYFYDRLIKIRQQKALPHHHKGFWDDTLIPQYQQAASAILVHNIWIPTKDKELVYRKYDLAPLIDTYKPIRFQEWPMLYLLGIVDTIDPIKAFQEKHRPSTILKNLLFSFDNRTLIIENKAKSPLIFNELTDRTRSLARWLNTEVEFSKNHLTIRMF